MVLNVKYPYPYEQSNIVTTLTRGDLTVEVTIEGDTLFVVYVDGERISEWQEVRGALGAAVLIASDLDDAQRTLEKAGDI